MDICLIRAGSDDVDLAAVAAFTVDELAALLGFHAGAEADFADTFAVGNLVGVMHDGGSSMAAEGRFNSDDRGERGLHFELGLHFAALGFAHPAAAFFGGLLKIGDAFHVLDEAFFFAEFFEAAKHLLGGLVAAAFDFDHAVPC